MEVVDSILKMIEELEQKVTAARPIPFTGRALIEPQELLEDLDKIRSLLPLELAQARSIAQGKEEMVARAQKEAQEIVERAGQQAEHLVQEAEISKRAQAYADQVVAHAQDVAQEIKAGAHSYADEVLGQLEQQLDKMQAAVRQGRKELRVVRPRANSA